MDPLNVKRNVWILARPLSGTKYLPILRKTSNTKFHLCHWAVLVSGVDVADVKAAMPRMASIRMTTIETTLGTLYELDRVDNFNTVHIFSNFGTKLLGENWNSVSCQYIGDTNLSDGEISSLGVLAPLNPIMLTCSGNNSTRSSRLQTL